MSDDIYVQRKKPSVPAMPAEAVNPLDRIQSIQHAVAQETGREDFDTMQEIRTETPPFEIAGNIPPAFREAMQRAQQPVNPVPPASSDRLSLMPLEGQVKPKPTKKPRPDSMVKGANQSTELTNVIAKIERFAAYDSVELPSKSKFYQTIPPIIHVRPMTGEEENILATPRFVKKGKAIDKIFENVIKEQIDTEELLSIDRTFLLIFLRGISYTPEYDVEVKCPSCTAKFNTMIDLNALDVEMCPDNFGPENLEGHLPKTGLHYKFRLATGNDEQMVTRRREMHVKEFGDQKEDDTLLYRSALLLENIDEVTNTNDLLKLLHQLPVADVNYIRNIINEPPFGVSTDVGLICPACNEEFEIALPLEANFFFPRKKKD